MFRTRYLVMLVLSALLLTYLPPGRASAGTAAPRQASTRSIAMQAGVEWQAQFWNNETLLGDPVLTRTDAAIAFDWGTSSPDPAVNADHFSARWTGQASFDVGYYRFNIVHDDGARLWVDGILVFDNWRAGYVSESVVVHLNAGPHTLRMEMFERDSSATAWLWWESTRSAPDHFGYTWDDGPPFAWIDATIGAKSALEGCSQFDGPVDIGFDFPFYENTYSQIYVSTSGLISFGGGSGSWSYVPMPLPPGPNNMIAALWTYLCAKSAGCNTAAIYYLSVGEAPNRYLVVQWQDVCLSSGGEPLTFEAILHENGDIVLQYRAVPDWVSATVGIEDDVGMDGLQYDDARLRDYAAVRFYRPTAAARVKTWPTQQGQFAASDSVVTFRQNVRNSGSLGPDAYELGVSSIWPVVFYGQDGSTPLTDSNGNGTVDTGALAPGSTLGVVAKVTVPASAQPGSACATTLTVRSSLDPTEQQTATLETTVPAPFAQAFVDTADGAVSLYLAGPEAQAVRKLTPNEYLATEVAVASTPGGGLVYAWIVGRGVESETYVTEIEYALVDRSGEITRPAARLTDHTTATLQTEDHDPALAVAPDGRIAVSWRRSLFDAEWREQSNVYLELLDANGNPLVEPTDLTGNTAWGAWGEENVPRFEEPTAAATDDDRFFLAWKREHVATSSEGCESYCPVDDVYYAVRASDGSVIKPVTRLSEDTPGTDDSHASPNLTTLDDNRVLLSWTRSGNYADIYYAVLDSSGSVLKEAASLTDDGTSFEDSNPDAAQLVGGSVVVAWNSSAWLGDGSESTVIRYAVLDGDLNRLTGPTALSHPAAVLGNGPVSVAQAGKWAILTWTDASRDYAPHLYYALLDGSGAQITPPVTWYTSASGVPRIETSYRGYGNAAFTWSAPPVHKLFLPVIRKK